jgi:hypothetical protein
MRVIFLAYLLFGVCGIAAAAETHVNVRLQAVAGGVRAEFSLSRQVPHLEFEYSFHQDQAQSWSLSPKNLELVDGIIRATDGQVFKTFAIDIRPDQTPGAAGYPPLVKIGENGFVFYAPYLIARGARTEFEFLVADDGAIVGTPQDSSKWLVPPKPARTLWAAERFIYLGPKANLSNRGNETYVMPPETPEWLREAILGMAPRAIAFFSTGLGALHERTTLLVSLTLDTGSPTDQVANSGGDVTEGGLILLHFDGRGWLTQNAWKSEKVDELLAHEISHLWNGHLNLTREERRTQAWLHEGAAKYWARLLLEPDAATRHRNVVDDLNLCSAALGGKGLLSQRLRGSAEYDCGEVVQWIVDLGVRTRTNGKQSVLDVWRPLFDFDEMPKRVYGSNDFLRAAYRAAPLTKKPLGRVFNPGGVKRWWALAADLKVFGIPLVEGEQPSIRPRRYLLRHLLTVDCGETTPRGLNDTQSESVLDTGDRCRALSGNPRMTHAEGYSLFTEAEKALRAVEKKCAAGDFVVLGGKTNPQLAKLRCTVPMAPLPPFFRIASQEQMR